MKIMLRKMNIDDAAQVNLLSFQLGYKLTKEETKKQIQEVIANPDHIAFVATIDNNVAGWIHAFTSLHIESKPFTEIGGLVVDKQHHKKGIAKQLIDKIILWSKENKINTVRVRTNVIRKETHDFYRHLQFKEMKEQKIFELTAE